MNMARVLSLVGAALVVCLGGLGLAVHLTRDEDNLQVDNLLAEAITREVARGETVDLRELARFEWDRVLIVAPGTPRDVLSARLGREWTGIEPVERGERLLFVRERRVVRFADYRGSHTFVGFERPVDELPRERAVLRVRAATVRRE